MTSIRMCGAGLMLAAAAVSLAAGARAQDAHMASAFAQAKQGVAQALHSRPRGRRLIGVSELNIPGGSPIGAKNTHLALYDLPGKATAVERAAVGAALDQALPAPWQRVGHWTSRYGERETWEYARNDGGQVTSVVCQVERGRATLAMSNTDPQAMLDSLREPGEPGVIVWSNHSVVRGLWGGFDDGSGAGPGVSFETPTGAFNLVQLHGSAQVTFEDYFGATLGFRFDPTGGDMQVFSVDVTGRYQANPDEDFFGTGPNSQAQRTMYDHQERGLQVTFAVRPAQALQFGAGEDYSGNRIFAGGDQDYASTQTFFAGSGLPGLARGANLLSTFGYAQLDTRDYPGNPHHGVYLRLSAADYSGTDHSGFGYWNYQADARGYVPLSFHDVLAWRGLSIWNDAKPGEQVPFFELARIGDSSILRGYRPYRFQGLNAVASSLEWRHFFDDDWGVFGFGDLGQVYGPGSELTRGNMRTTWGAGLIFLDSRRQTSFKLYFGITRGEGNRLFATQGPAF